MVTVYGACFLWPLAYFNLQDGEIWTFSVRAFDAPRPERTINVNYDGFAEGNYSCLLGFKMCYRFVFFKLFLFCFNYIMWLLMLIVQLSYNKVEWDTDVSVGDELLVDGGMVRFEVIEKIGPDVKCRCTDPGLMLPRANLTFWRDGSLVRERNAMLPTISSKVG